jgi:hypothetical protein
MHELPSIAVRLVFLAFFLLLFVVPIRFCVTGPGTTETLDPRDFPTHEPLEKGDASQKERARKTPTAGKARSSYQYRQQIDSEIRLMEGELCRQHSPPAEWCTVTSTNIRLQDDNSAVATVRFEYQPAGSSETQSKHFTAKVSLERFGGGWMVSSP